MLALIIMFTTCEVVINNNSQIFATVHLFKSSHGYYLTEDKNKKHTQNHAKTLSKSSQFKNLTQTAALLTAK